MTSEKSAETANRIPKIANAQGIPLDDIRDSVFVENLRGRFRIIVIDAFYRAMPCNMDGNDNGTMASVYNHLDAYTN